MKKPPRIFLGVYALLFLFVLFAPTSPSHADILFDGFGDTSKLQINNDAGTTATTDGTVLRLTDASSFQSGSAFSLNKVSTDEFLSVFSFRISDSGGTSNGSNPDSGADGLVFVVQNVANNVGSSGGGMGYQGISNSVGIEFDTWLNSGSDPSASHVGIDVNGSVNFNDAGMGPTADISAPALDAGDRWWSWVDYDGSDLNVYLLQSESATEPAIPAAPLLSFPIDLNATLGGSDLAFVGFTAATGGAWGNHDITYWRYTEAAIPEPASGLLIAIGTLCFVGQRRRRNS